MIGKAPHDRLGIANRDITNRAGLSSAFIVAALQIPDEVERFHPVIVHSDFTGRFPQLDALPSGSMIQPNNESDFLDFFIDLDAFAAQLRSAMHRGRERDNDHERLHARLK